MRVSSGSWAVPLISLVAGFAGGLLAAWLVLGDPVVAEETGGQIPAVVSAKEFRLVDQRGKSRAIIGFSAEEEPYLAMLHRSEARVIWLGLSEESGLSIHDVDGKTRLVLSLDTAGEPSLILRDRQHRTRTIHTQP
ncbi:MAG: hypothetical protein KGJ82_12195 [Nitrospirota bacterium]|nr:hypothetical protein [Nitrospirota bacterium]